MVDERHLVYFKELLEGNAEISFKAYLSNNEDSLRKQFSPARFARLKLKSIDEIIKILDEENVSYSINDHAEGSFWNSTLGEQLPCLRWCQKVQMTL